MRKRKMRASQMNKVITYAMRQRKKNTEKLDSALFGSTTLRLRPAGRSRSVVLPNRAESSFSVFFLRWRMAYVITLFIWEARILRLRIARGRSRWISRFSSSSEV